MGHGYAGRLSALESTYIPYHKVTRGEDLNGKSLFLVAGVGFEPTTFVL